MKWLLPGLAVYAVAGWRFTAHVPTLLACGRRRRVAARKAVAELHLARRFATGEWFDDLPVSCMCCHGPACTGKDDPQ